MTNLQEITVKLEKEARVLAQEQENIKRALVLLKGGRVNGPLTVRPKRRKLSPQAIKKIADAQRKRWAKWKAARRAVVAKKAA